VKGAAAEASETTVQAEGAGAGLRENMSQTVTKVERCHRSGAGEKLSHRIIACMTARFPFYRKAYFFVLFSLLEGNRIEI